MWNSTQYIWIFGELETIIFLLKKSVIQTQMDTAKQSDVLQTNLTKYKLLYSVHLFFIQIFPE